jgi:hypothetical protein
MKFEGKYPAVLTGTHGPDKRPNRPARQGCSPPGIAVRDTPCGFDRLVRLPLHLQATIRPRATHVADVRLARSASGYAEQGAASGPSGRRSPARAARRSPARRTPDSETPSGRCRGRDHAATADRTPRNSGSGWADRGRGRGAAPHAEASSSTRPGRRPGRRRPRPPGAASRQPPPSLPGRSMTHVVPSSG